MSALFRLVAVQNGIIIIGRTDISTIPTDSLRRGLNGIPQSSFFLQESFRLNLDPESSTLDDASVWSALHKVQLANLVSSWGGLDTELKSTILSYGQRQLLSLARALQRPRKVVVLDEVTSAMDEDTDRLIRSIVRTEFAGCTVLAVAHRLEWMMESDRVAVLHNGNLVEFGTPQQLREKPQGEFKSLWEAHRR